MAHRKLHDIDSVGDHNGISGTENNFMSQDSNGLPKDSGKKDTDYSLADGTRAFTGVVGGITPTADAHLTTKAYVDGVAAGIEWQDSVLDKDLTAPPGGESGGERYMVASGATGAWSGLDGYIVEWNGSSWDTVAPTEGLAAFVDDENKVYIYNGSAWVVMASVIGDHNSMSGFQGGTTDEYYHMTNTQHAALTSAGGVADASSEHTHDDRYYSETEVDALSFSATGDSGGSEAINFGDTLTIAGGNGIVTARSGATVTASADVNAAGAIDNNFASAGELGVNVDDSTIEIATNVLQVKADGIDDTHIDWGSGAGQVDATDLPVDSGGTYGGSATTVQDALEEIEGNLSSTYAFKTILVSGQSDVVADAVEDSLTLVAGTDITITTDAGTDTITINAGQDATDLTASLGVERSGDNFQADVNAAGAIDNNFASAGELGVNVDDSTIEIATNALQVKADGINETHIDWGSGANQVDGSSIPLDSGGSYTGSATTVQDAIEEIEAASSGADVFKTISVSGQSDVVADGAVDTLTLVAGTDITITTDAGTDTITINAGQDATDLTASLGVERSGDNFQADVNAAGAIDNNFASAGELGVLVDSSTIEISGNALQVMADGINETHIDWGSGANQVDGSSIPIDSGGSWAGSATTIQDALEELESDLGNYQIMTDAYQLKVYSQAAMPDMSTDITNSAAFWIDTDDSNAVYLIMKRGTSDIVAVELT